MFPADFHFLRPLWFLALPPLALLLWRLWTAHRQRASAWQGQCDPELLAALLTRPDGGRRSVPLLLLAFGWLLAVTALAGPTWSELPQPVYRSQQARVLVLDLSRSMDATDLSPSRLAQARFRILDLLDGYKEGQTGLIAYAGEAFVVSPLTDDSATIAALVPSLDTSLMPAPGSRTDLALEQAGALLRQAGVQTLGQSGSQSGNRAGEVILITDGATPSAAALAAARTLRSAGHRLDVLALGSLRGAPIPLPGGGFLTTADGNIVMPGIDRVGLERLAINGGGRLLSGNHPDAIDALLTPPAASTVKAEPEAGLHADRWLDQGPWLVLALLLLAAPAFRRGWFGTLALGLLLGLTLQLLSVAPLLAAEARLDRQELQSIGDSKGKLFVELEVDPMSPYVQAQTRLTLRIFHTEPLQDARVSEPETGDALLLRLGRDTAYQVERDGRKYEVIERRYALFPQHSGRLEIPPITFTSQMRVSGKHSVFGTNLPYGGRFDPLRTLRRRSEPVTLRVRPRGDGSNMGDDGDREAWLPARGLTLNESWDPDPPRFHVGQPITRTLTLTADGLSGAQLPLLVIPAIDGLKVYPDRPVTEQDSGTDSGTGGVIGRQIIRAALVPERPGPLTLPAIEVHWWNTTKDAARTLVLPARVVEVLPGNGIEAPPTAIPRLLRNQQPVPREPGATSLSTIVSNIGNRLPTAPSIDPLTALLTVAWLLTLALWLRERRRNRQLQPPSATTTVPRTASLARAAAELRRRCRANDAGGSRDALLAWANAGTSDPTTHINNLGQLADRLSAAPMGAAAAAESLRELDRLLYRDPHNDSPNPVDHWDGQACLRALRPILGHSLAPAGRASTVNSRALPPLYPTAERGPS